MKQDEQAKQSKQVLTKALFDLMKKQSFESISIKSLAEEANVSRLTFYRHFESKEDILLLHMDSVFKNYYQELLEISDLNLNTALSLCFLYWSRDEELANLLLEHDLTNVLEKVFSGYLPLILDINILPMDINYFQRKFIEGGLLSVMVDWMLHPKGRSAEDMADLIVDLVSINV